MLSIPLPVAEDFEQPLRKFCAKFRQRMLPLVILPPLPWVILDVGSAPSTLIAAICRLVSQPPIT
jgi:hypothetical protein